MGSGTESGFIYPEDQTLLQGGGSIENRPNMSSGKLKKAKRIELKPQLEVSADDTIETSHFGVRNPGETDFNKDDAIFPKP